jgi:hypothetical protein
MRKFIGIALLLCITACQASMTIDIIVPMCPTETSYTTNTFIARSESGIDGILLNNRYLKPMHNESLDLEFDFVLNPKDSFVVYANGAHHTIKTLDKNYPGAELKMNGHQLTITYFCETPIFE